MASSWHLDREEKKNMAYFLPLEYHRLHSFSYASFHPHTHTHELHLPFAVIILAAIYLLSMFRLSACLSPLRPPLPPLGILCKYFLFSLVRSGYHFHFKMSLSWQRLLLLAGSATVSASASSSSSSSFSSSSSSLAFASVSYALLFCVLFFCFALAQSDAT